MYTYPEVVRQHQSANRITYVQSVCCVKNIIFIMRIYFRELK